MDIRRSTVYRNHHHCCLAAHTMILLQCNRTHFRPSTSRISSIYNFYCKTLHSKKFTRL